MFNYIKGFIAAFRAAYQERLAAERRQREQWNATWIKLALKGGAHETVQLMGKPPAEVYKEYLRRRSIQEQLEEDTEDGSTSAA